MTKYIACDDDLGKGDERIMTNDELKLIIVERKMAKMKSYRFDYHSQLGWLNRHWVEATDYEDAEKKAAALCNMLGWEIVKNSLKVVDNSSAAKEFVNDAFEQACLSDVAGFKR